MNQEKRTLLVVFVTVLMDLIGFGIIIPISPFYAESLGATPAMITLLGAGYSLMQFVFAPLWGRLSDRYGRRPIILSSIAFATVGYLCFAFSESFTALFLARLLSGFGTANLGAAQAIVADSTPPERRARGMGILGAALGLGFILGPALGGILGQWGLRVPIFVAAGFSAVNFGLAFVLLPETRQLGKPTVPVHPFRRLLNLFQSGDVRPMLFTFLLYSAAFSMMEQVLSLFVQAAWVGVSPDHPNASAGRASVLTAWAMIAVGLTIAAIQGGALGKLVARFGEKALLVWGLVIVGVTTALIPATPALGGYAVFIVVMVVLAFGSGISTPSLSSLLSRATTSGEQGHTMGVGQSLSALGRAIGPALAGVLFEGNIGYPFWVSGGAILFVSVLASRIRPVDKA